MKRDPIVGGLERTGRRPTGTGRQPQPQPPAGWGGDAASWRSCSTSVLGHLGQIDGCQHRDGVTITVCVASCDAIRFARWMVDTYMQDCSMSTVQALPQVRPASCQDGCVQSPDPDPAAKKRHGTRFPFLELASSATLRIHTRCLISTSRIFFLCIYLSYTGCLYYSSCTDG